MASQIFREPLLAVNCNNLKKFDDRHFRDAFTAQRMQTDAYLFKQASQVIAQSVLQDLWRRTQRNEIRILSMGCGPGSDLLGILGAVDSVLRSDPVVGWGRTDGELTCHCTGVDAFNWNRDVFERKLQDLCNKGMLERVNYRFVHTDMESFVCDSSRPNGLIADEFDFICLSFADAGSYPELVGEALPQLLSEFGCVIVLDFDTPSVTRLDKYGYCGCSVGSNMLIKIIKRIASSRVPYRPSLVSPFQRYKLIKNLEEQRRLKQLAESFQLLGQTGMEGARYQRSQEVAAHIPFFGPSGLFIEWQKAWNKDEIKFYASPDFRRDYINSEMDRRVAMFKERSISEVLAVLRNLWNQTRRNEIRILSLGCGPGSDLLGILRAVDSVLQSDVQVGWRNRELTCHCTGVDAFEWNRNDFVVKLKDLFDHGNFGLTDPQFVHGDMEHFVCDSSRPNGLRADEFDFICLSFADAGRNLKLVGEALPQLLSEFGRVLVLDNNIPPVRRLGEFGYSCTFNGGHVCMQTRGRSPSLVPYQPAFSSPFWQHQRQ